jgi:hypothetical protein
MAAFAKRWRREWTSRASERVRAVHHAWEPRLSFCGSSVIRQPGGVPGRWGVLRAFKMYAPNMMAVQAWQFSVKLQLAATAILLIGLRSSS